MNGVTISEIAGFFALLGTIIGGVKWFIVSFKRSISDPIRSELNDLNKGLESINNSRKENEKKLFNVTDDHSKDITKLENRVNIVEVVNQSNTLRIDRLEEKRIN